MIHDLSAGKVHLNRSPWSFYLSTCSVWAECGSQHQTMENQDQISRECVGFHDLLVTKASMVNDWTIQAGVKNMRRHISQSYFPPKNSKYKFMPQLIVQGSRH
jgi:hypothetical protein